MKTIAAIALGACLIGGSATPSQQASKAGTWKQAATFDLHYEAPKELAPGEGRPGSRGAGVINFVLEDRPGAAIDVLLDDDRIGIFVGIAIEKPAKNVTAAAVRVRFTEKSGKTTDVPVDAHGGTAAMLFKSPEGLAAHEFSSFQVLYDEAADWTKKKK